jgi:type I restriction enzyme S subunit
MSIEETAPTRWDIVKLEDVVDILDSGRVPVNAKERGTRVGQVPYYGATGQVGWIDDFLFDEELVLLGEDGAPFLEPAKQKAYIVRGKSWVNNHAHVLRARSDIPNAYIKYYLDTVDYHEYVTGTTRLKLNQAAMRRIPVPLAPKNERVRIVAEIEKQFSRLDEAVTNLKRAKANLKRYKASVLKAAVEGKLTEDWRKQHPNVEPASKLLERILVARRAKGTGRGQYNQPVEPETNDFPRLPSKWLWARLDAIASPKGGITVDKNRKAPTARTVPYLRVANVQRGYLDLSEIKTIEAPDADTKDLRLLPGDILFNEGGDRDKLGRGWIWDGQLPECIHQNHVFRARLYSAEVSPKLVSWWGNSFGQAYFSREGKQTTNLASLNLTKLSAFPIPLPPAAEQQQIVVEVERRLSVLEKLEAAVEANLTRGDRLRQSILAKAFCGELTTLQ